MRWLPDPAAPDRLADVEVSTWAEPSEEELALAGAAYSRHTDRSQYSAREIPSHTLDELVRTGDFPEARLQIVTGEHRYALATAFVKAAFCTAPHRLPRRTGLLDRPQRRGARRHTTVANPSPVRSTAIWCCGTSGALQRSTRKSDPHAPRALSCW
ncbi:hypothetical protein [Halopolyspora algeriensis]|uniref:hypothetical protein n=1 Tax=Halopolyspora algeriensis TaxID=1500506 RepID=UPI000DF26179|nr:hypothetical protein [Halopolyspora algeriensis]